MDFILPAVVLAIPLIVMPGLLFHYDSVPKIALLAIAMALVLARPRVLIDRISRLWQTQLGKWLCILAMAQIAWTSVATATSTRVVFSIFGSGWRRFGLITVIAVVVFAVATAAQLLVSPDVTKSIFRAMSIAAIVASIYTIAQYFGIDPFQNGAGYRAQDGDFTIVRPPGTLGHADYLGWWLVIALFCAWGLYRVAKGAWRVVALAATILASIATVLSGTRSAIAAAIVATGFLLITGRAHLSRRHYAAIGGIAVLSVVFYLSPAGTMLQARVKWSSDEAPGGARPLLWRDTLKMIAARPLVGFGPETFAAEFPRFQSEELSRLVPDFYHESPHNVALDAVTSEGIPGLLIAACWWALGIRGYRSVARQE